MQWYRDIIIIIIDSSFDWNTWLYDLDSEDNVPDDIMNKWYSQKNLKHSEAETRITWAFRVTLNKVIRQKENETKT